MARYAKVDVRIWDDERVRAMTPIPPCGQGLWIRLLVSRHRSAVPGILCVGEAALAEEFGWTLEAFRKAFGEAFAKGMVKADWNARLVWIPKACLYNRPESPNVVRSWRIPWDETPECELKLTAFRALKAFVEGLPEAFAKAFGEACRQPSPNQDPDPEQEQEQEQEKRSIRSPRAKRSEPSQAFAQFWSAYPRKVAKGAAEKAWPGDDTLPAILAAIEWQRKQKSWQDPSFIPHPATWLRAKRWLDEKPYQPGPVPRPAPPQRQVYEPKGDYAAEAAADPDRAKPDEQDAEAQRALAELTRKLAENVTAPYGKE